MTLPPMIDPLRIPPMDAGEHNLRVWADRKAIEFIDRQKARIAQLEAARELSAVASATMRDESIAKSARIAALEALLREVRNDACGGNLDDALRHDIDAALARSSALETEPKPVQFGCQCYSMECRKGTLASNEYCTRDRKRAGLALSDKPKTEADLTCATCGYPLDDHGGMGLPCPHSKSPASDLPEHDNGQT